MGYRGKVDEQEQAASHARAEHDPAGHRHRARRRRSRRCRSGSATSRSLRRSAERRRNADRTPLTKRSSPRSLPCDAEGIERIGTLSDDAFLAAGIALYAGEGAKTDGNVKFANTDPGDGSLLLRVAAPVTSRSTRPGSGCVSTCTKVSTSRPPRPTGQQVTGVPRGAVQPSRTAPSPIRASARTSTSSGASTCATPARRPIGGSWVSYGHCYRRAPFRGSSIGRAFGC